jgi:hypothetical protein
MEVMKNLHDVLLQNNLTSLEESQWETVRAWCLVTILSFHNLPHLPFHKISLQPTGLCLINRIKRKTVHPWPPTGLLGVQLFIKLDNVLLDLRSVRRNCTINIQGVDGVPSSVAVGHYAKNFVHLSPSLSHKILDFCLQLTSSIRVDLSNSLTISTFFILSSTPKTLPSCMISKARSSSKRIFYLSTLPNTSFHLYKSTFKALACQLKWSLASLGRDKSPTIVSPCPQSPQTLATYFQIWRTYYPYEIHHSQGVLGNDSSKASFGTHQETGLPTPEIPGIYQFWTKRGGSLIIRPSKSTTNKREVHHPKWNQKTPS